MGALAANCRVSIVGLLICGLFVSKYAFVEYSRKLNLIFSGWIGGAGNPTHEKKSCFPQINFTSPEAVNELMKKFFGKK